MEQEAAFLLIGQKSLNSKQKTLRIRQLYYVYEMFQKTKDFPVDDKKYTGFYGYVYDFSVDYDTVAVDDTLDIHQYPMKKHNKKQCLDLLKKCL